MQSYETKVLAHIKSTLSLHVLIKFKLLQINATIFEVIMKNN